MVMPEQYNDFSTPAHLAHGLGTDYRAVLAAIDNLRLVPRMRLNLTPYFDGHQCRQIIDELRRQGELR
jgi:hypothetical protein